MLRKNHNYKLIMRYTILWIVCAIVVFYPLYSARKTLITADDGFNQYYPVFRYLRGWYKGIVTGDVKMFDLVIGLGDDVIGTLNYYGLGDILLIPFCLAPTSLLDISYTLSILFRLYLAGAVFLFLFNNEVPAYSRCTGAIIYSFCPYVFENALMFLNFATPLVWLPVITAGVKDILNGKKRFSKKLFFGGTFPIFEWFLLFIHDCVSFFRIHTS